MQMAKSDNQVKAQDQAHNRAVSMSYDKRLGAVRQFLGNNMTEDARLQAPHENIIQQESGQFSINMKEQVDMQVDQLRHKKGEKAKN